MARAPDLPWLAMVVLALAPASVGCTSRRPTPGLDAAVNDGPHSTPIGDAGPDAPGSLGSVPLGGACDVSAACNSRLCVDGLCCDSPCGGRCQRCNSQGRCQPLAAGTLCGLGSCVVDHLLGAPVCDGRGACSGVNPVVHCAPYLCRDGACTVSCASDQDCEVTFSCRSGVCLATQVGGCNRNEECASGFCVSGVCCDRACQGRCESCTTPAARGRCTPLPDRLVPDGGCGVVEPAQDAGAGPDRPVGPDG